MERDRWQLNLQNKWIPLIYSLEILSLLQPTLQKRLLKPILGCPSCNPRQAVFDRAFLNSEQTK